MSRRQRIGGLLLAAATFLALPAAAEPSDDRPLAGGRLAWTSTDDLDLVGDLWADLPLVRGRGGSGFLALDLRTAIVGSDDLTFLVRDVEYGVEAGWRSSSLRAGAAAAFVGQRGKELVDRDGGAAVRYAGVGWESRGWRRGEAPTRIDWRADAAAVVDDDSVEADALLRAEARIELAGRATGARLEFDLFVEALADGSDVDADIRGGPRLSWLADGGRRADLFLYYQYSENPLGIGDSSVLAGFAWSEPTVGARNEGDAPDVSGLVAAGAGDGRESGQLRLRFLSPAWGAGTRVALEVDANLLSAEERSELYYLYHAGLEHPLWDGIAGAYFYHRSNHLVDDPLAPGVTSLNVIEAGHESLRWHAEAGALEPGALDWRVRGGWLVDSDFGEDRRWHVRGGARWVLPFAPRDARFYLVAELESGDVDRETFAVGVAPAASFALQLEYREDDQFFDEDRSALLLTARYGF